MTYQRTRLSGIIANVESITYNLRKNNQQLSNILANVSSITDSVANSEITSTISNTNESVAHLAEILEKINNNEGSLGLLINDDSLYNNLDASAKELELLLEDLRVNPDRYIHFSVFGRKSKKK
jgi:phospholipid/cholesterol/gamma-HCH transport system substrate-binding protein